jgi:hypothetical protein
MRCPIHTNDHMREINLDDTLLYICPICEMGRKKEPRRQLEPQPLKVVGGF